MAEKKRSEQLQQLFETMGSIFHLVKSSIHTPNEKLNLTPAEMRILILLAHKKDGLSIKDIAVSFDVSSSAASQFIDKLVEKQLIIRDEDATDRRSVKVYLSEGTRKILNEKKKQYLLQLEPFLSNLSDKELEILIKLLSKIKNKQGK